MTSGGEDTQRRPNGPGAALVVLRRGRTSTDVLLFGSENPLDDPGAYGDQGAPGSHGRLLPRARARADRTQWQLAEDLLDENRLDEVTRLYASALTIHEENEACGVFVAFVERAVHGGSLRAAGEWVDLREAIARLPEPWSERLGAVRERFIARSPDEALRVR